MTTDDRDTTVGRSGSEADMDARDIRPKSLDGGTGTPSGSLHGPRRQAVLWVGALLLLVGPVLTISSWVLPGVVGHASAAGAPHAQKVVLFDDVTISLGETRETVVVVGGRVDILGTVENVVVVVGGDVFIGPEAQVATDKDPDETAVVVVFGDVTAAPGARVGGERVDVGGWLSGWLGAMAISPDYEMWSAASIGGWAWLAVFFGIAAVIASAIAPRQLAVVRERVRHHFFSSFGWGTLGMLIGIPIVTVLLLLLILVVVGLFLLLPWLGVIVPGAWLFGFVAVGAAVGRLILGNPEARRGPVMLAAVLGVVILSILWWIPVAGSIIIFLLGMAGFGATLVAVWDWSRYRGRSRVEPGSGPAPPDAPVA